MLQENSKIPLYTPDQKIIRLISYLKFKRIINTEKEFCESTNVIRQTLYKIRNSTASFTVEHIENICRNYNVNANWIFGIQNNVFNSPDSIETKDLS